MRRRRWGIGIGIVVAMATFSAAVGIGVHGTPIPVGSQAFSVGSDQYGQLGVSGLVQNATPLQVAGLVSRPSPRATTSSSP